MSFIFLIFLLGTISISIIGFSLYLGISPMPSSRKAKEVLLKNLQSIEETIPTGIFFELGAGIGSIACPLARAFPNRTIYAYERSPIPFFILLLRKKIFGIENLKVIYKNFFEVDLKDAALIYTYLFPKAMERLKGKLFQEKIRIFLVSLAFALPDTKPRQVFEVRDFSCSKIYFYKLEHE